MSIFLGAIVDRGGAIGLAFIAISLVATFMAASGSLILRRAAAICFGCISLALLVGSARVLFGGTGRSSSLFALLGALLMAWFGQKIWRVAVGDWKGDNARPRA